MFGLFAADVNNGAYTRTLQLMSVDSRYECRWLLRQL